MYKHVIPNSLRPNVIVPSKMQFLLSTVILVLTSLYANSQCSNINDCLKKSSHIQWEIGDAFRNSSGNEKLDWPLENIQCSDGGYIAVGFAGGESVIVKYSGNGKKLWDYQWTGGGALLDILETPTSYIACGGFTKPGVGTRGYLFKINKDGDASSAKCKIFSYNTSFTGAPDFNQVYFSFSRLKLVPSSSELVVLGGMTRAAYGNLVGDQAETFMFGIDISDINESLTTTTIYRFETELDAPSGLVNWFTRFGNFNRSNITSSPFNTTSSSYTTNNITTSRTGTGNPWPEIPNDPNAEGSVSNQSYNMGFGSGNILIDGSGTNYNVYITGAARWKTFTSTIFNDNASTPAYQKFTSSDVFVAKFSISPSTPNNTILVPSWTQTYPEIPKDNQNSSVYESAYSEHSPRNPTLLLPTTPVDVKGKLQFYYSNLVNSGAYLGVDPTDPSTILVGASYNNISKGTSITGFDDVTTTANELDDAFGEDYKEADIGAFVIDKSNGNTIWQVGYCTDLGHASGDDFKLKFVQDNFSNYYYIASTQDIHPVREFASSSEEDMLIGKCNLNLNYITPIWSRDVFTLGNPTRTVPHGICGFGLGLTMDQGLIVCGNNNQNKIGANPNLDDGDDFCIVKLSPDYQSNMGYTTGYYPYGNPVTITSNQTIQNSTMVIGVPIIVSAGKTLTIDNSTLEFANSQFLYDTEHLLHNGIDATNPRHGGFIGIIIQPGGHVNVINNSILKGIDNPNGIPAMWDGIMVKGNNSVQLANSSANVNLGIGSGSRIEHARNGITTDSRTYQDVTGLNIFYNSKPYYPYPSTIQSTPSNNSTWFLRKSVSEKTGVDGGGFIYGGKSTFKDNENDVDFGFCPSVRNWSQFYDCKFESSTHLCSIESIDEDGEWGGSKLHMKLTDNNGIRVYSCHFNGYDALPVNGSTNLIYPHKNGDGIYCENSNLYLDKTYHVGPTPSSFNGLYHALEINHGAVSLLPTFILNSEFGVDHTTLQNSNPNVENIFIHGTNPFGTNIFFNTIGVMDKATSNNIPLYPYGVHIEGESGFLMENNKITGDGKLNDNYGITITDCGESSKKVRLNTIDNIKHPAVSLWNNRLQSTSTSISTGLEWQCNIFGANADRGEEVLSAADIFNPVTGQNHNATLSVGISGQRYQQGICGISGQEFKAANNRFLFTSSSSNLNLFRDNNSTDFDYTFYGQANDYDPNPDIFPSTLTATTCNSAPVSSTFFTDNCVASVIPYVPASTVVVSNPDPGTVLTHSGDVKVNSIMPIKDNGSEYASEIVSKMAEASALNNLLEAGDGSDLVAYINNPGISSSILRQYLLAVGPYLSDDMLNRAMEREYNPLTNADLAEIILANSPLSDSVYDDLDRIRPTVGGNWTIIQAQYPEYSPREIVEMQIAEKQSEITNVSAYAKWSAMSQDNGADYGTAGATAMIVNNKIDAFYMAIANNDITTASTALATFSPNSEEQEDAKKMASWLLYSKQHNIPIKEVILSNIEDVIRIANHHTPSAYNAKTALYEYANGDKPVAMRPVRAQSGNKVGATAKRNFTVRNHIDLLNENIFSVYPNPASNVVSIDYKFKDENRNAQIIISDILGKHIIAQSLPKDKNVISIGIENLVTGLYTFEIVNNNQLIETRKLNVQH